MILKGNFGNIGRGGACSTSKLLEKLGLESRTEVFRRKVIDYTIPFYIREPWSKITAPFFIQDHARLPSA